MRYKPNKNKKLCYIKNAFFDQIVEFVTPSWLRFGNNGLFLLSVKRHFCKNSFKVAQMLL